MKTRLLFLLVLLGLGACAWGQNVLITEFKAINGGPLRDEDGFFSDWIELHNAGSSEAHLGGWFLTDNRANLRQWSFPLTNLPPGGFLVVFASGKNRPIAGRELHTSFQLRSGGEYLALVQPDGVTIAQEFAPAYPVQFSGLSYGFPMNGPAVLIDRPGYLPPTPRQPNPLPGDPPPLAITELMYNPAPPPGFIDGSPFEFIEFKNTGTNDLDLTGMFFAAGVVFTFPNAVLAPEARALVVADTRSFQARYGTGLPVVGQWTGTLGDGGERLVLIATNGSTIFDFTYDDSWHRLSDGHGFSLVPVDETALPPAYALRSTWRSSGQRDGSPGQLNPPSLVPPILVNEVLTRSEAPFEDAIELFNPGTNDVDISGWLLTDDSGRPAKYPMPFGAFVPAGGFLALDEHAFNPANDDPLAAGFGLGDFGEEIYLFSTDTNGGLSGFAHGFRFGPAEPNVPFGRHVTSTGEEHFVPQAAMTFFATNAGPKVGPVILSEIFFHPPGLDSAASQFVSFIELRNISSQPVLLYDPLFPTNSWLLRDAGVSAFTFAFPAGTVLPPGGYALIVGFDSTNAVLLDQFAAANRVTPGTPVFGPWTGSLGRSAGSIELLRPDAPQPLFVPYVLIERVRYSDAAPWPPGADGTGASIHRINEPGYGDDPVNWRAAYPTPGLPGGLPPGIILQPADVTAHVGSTVLFDATAIGTVPVTYQWLFNGLEIPGASASTLRLAGVQPAFAGAYSCLVSNAAAAGLSRIATLAVFDTNRPVVRMNAPAEAQARVTHSQITLTGTAEDDAAVFTVLLQQNSAPPFPLAGTAAWSAALNLPPGHHTLRVFAVDWAGNVSLTNTVFVLVQPDPARLGLLITGAGTVSGATNAQPLRTGRRYTLRATPAPGHFFSHWVDWETGLLSTNPALTFVMSPHRSFTAAFTPGPFAGLAGSYNGLFQDTAGSAHLNAGYFALTVGHRGGYTGRLNFRGASHGLHGRFGEDFSASKTINRPGTNDLLVTLQLTPGSDRVSGAVSEARFTSELAGRRSRFSPGSAATNFAGRYTVAFHAVISATNATSQAAMTVGAGGRVVLVGRLPDRAPVAKSVFAGEDGRVPFYHSFYQGAGSAFGWLSFTNDATNQFRGPLLWTRTGSRSFTNALEVLGSR